MPGLPKFDAQELAERRIEGVLKTTPVQLDPEQEDAHELVNSLPPELQEALNSSKALKKNGGELVGLTDAKANIHARHQLIVRLRAQGMHTTRIARAVGVTERTIRNVIKHHYAKVAEDLKNENFDQFILMLADGYLEDIDRLTDLIESMPRQFGPALVGAIKMRQESRQKYIDILADFGFLKRTPIEVDVHHSGTPQVQQQVVVLSPDDLKAASMEFLRTKRRLLGEQPNVDTDRADEKRSALVVGAYGPDNPADDDS